MTELAGIDVARELGIETAVVAWKSFADRAAFERALAETLEAHRAEVIVLAGFMRVLSPEFAAALRGPPHQHSSGAAAQVSRACTRIAACLEAGDAEHGASVHFATAELDGGPVVLQSRLAVRPAETETDLAARVLATEHVILPRVLGWLAEGRLAWRDGRGWLDGQPLDAPARGVLPLRRTPLTTRVLLAWLVLWTSGTALAAADCPQPFKITFGVEWRGMSAGTSTLELTRRSANEYTYRSSNTARGFFRLAHAGHHHADEHTSPS